MFLDKVVISYLEFDKLPGVSIFGLKRGVSAAALAKRLVRQRLIYKVLILETCYERYCHTTRNGFI